MVNYPLSFNYPLELTLVDFGVQLILIQTRVYWPMLGSSYVLYTAAPYDMPILWLSLTGLYNPLLGLALALLAKLPDTASQWSFILHKPTDANDIEYYLITALPWFWITMVWAKKKLSNKLDSLI